MGSKDGGDSLGPHIYPIVIKSGAFCVAQISLLSPTRLLSCVKLLPQFWSIHCSLWELGVPNRARNGEGGVAEDLGAMRCGESPGCLVYPALLLTVMFV